MSNTTKMEILLSIKARYRSAPKKEKKIILNEFCTLCDYSRKYAIRVLNHSSPRPKCSYKLSKRGRKKKYKHPMIYTVLRDLWVTTNLPCSRRLKSIIPLWLPHYRKHIIVNGLLKIHQNRS